MQILKTNKQKQIFLYLKGKVTKEDREGGRKVAKTAGNKQARSGTFLHISHMGAEDLGTLLVLSQAH